MNLYLKTVETVYTKEADTYKLSCSPMVKPLLQVSVIPNFDANETELGQISTRYAWNHGTYSQ